jgi:translation initiation factor IF-2
VFKVGQVGKVAGCAVIEGLLKANGKIRIMRGKRNPIYTGTLTSLKVVKETVEEVPLGSECGTSFDEFQVWLSCLVLSHFITITNLFQFYDLLLHESLCE